MVQRGVERPDSRGTARSQGAWFPRVFRSRAKVPQSAQIGGGNPTKVEINKRPGGDREASKGPGKENQSGSRACQTRRHLYACCLRGIQKSHNQRVPEPARSQCASNDDARRAAEGSAFARESTLSGLRAFYFGASLASAEPPQI